MAHNFSYGVYKNEFNATMVEFFKQTFEVESETGKVLTLTNLSEDDCKNIAACMFKSVEECKAIFKVKIIDEEFQEFRNNLADAHAKIKEALIAYHNAPAFIGGDLMDRRQMDLYDAAHLANSTLNKAFREFNK